MSNLILRHNIGMVRDAFILPDAEVKDAVMIGIRQTRFNEDGAEPQVKLLRLPASEMEALVEFWQQHNTPAKR